MYIHQIAEYGTNKRHPYDHFHRTKNTISYPRLGHPDTQGLIVPCSNACVFAFVCRQLRLGGSTKKTVQVDRDRKFRPSVNRIRHHVTNLYLFNIFNSMFWCPSKTNQLSIDFLIPGFQKCQPHMSNGNPCIFHVPRVGMSTFQTLGTAWPTINGRFHRPKGLPAQLAILVVFRGKVEGPM